MTTTIHWLSTKQRPKRYDRQSLHAVRCKTRALDALSDKLRALCGVGAPHGWNTEPEIENRCARCDALASNGATR